MKANYHTHTTRCQHALGADEEFVLAALKGGFHVLGFSDHAPWPFGRGFVSGTRMTCDQLPDYIASIQSLRARYAGHLALHIGLEAEYFPRYHDHLLSMRDQGVSYYILGQHFADSEEDHIYIGMDCHTYDGVMRYAEAVARGVRTGLYSYICHPDLYLYGRRDADFDVGCERAADMICQAAREQGIPLEYNLLGLRDRLSGGMRGYPSRAFWEYARKWGVDAILGVDAHEPVNLTDTRLWEIGRQELTEMGYHIIDHMNMEG